MFSGTYTPSQIKAEKLLDTGHNLLITGKPGTGKTSLIKDYVERKANSKRILLTASTGLAASNLNNGKTLHSTLNWRPSKTDYDYGTCVEKIKNCDVLVVDEVSMLSHCIIKHLYLCLQKLSSKPQLVMIGDFFQLPPVTTSSRKKYPFESPYWEQLNLFPCLLTDVVRQKDNEFLAMLELARYGDPSCILYFNEHTQKKKIENAITLCSRNDIAHKINLNFLSKLPGNT